MKYLFENTWKYARFILKRERKYFIIWFLALFFLTLGQAQSFVDLYPTAEDRNNMADAMNNPALVALMGIPYGYENCTLGVIFNQQTLLFTAVAAAIMNIIFMCRNTAGDEEKGISEILRAYPVGRQFQITASLEISYIVNAVFALVIGLGLYGMKIESIDLEGSLLFGAVVGVSGIFFASISALFAQLTLSGAAGLSFGVLGTSYIVRAIGDIGSNAVAKLSPLGLLSRSKIYSKNNFEPVAVIFALSVVLTAAAVILNTKRDYGSGLFEKNNRKDKSSPLLRSPFAFAARLHRTSTVVWLVSVIVMGISFGAMMNEIEGQLESNDMMKDIFLSGAGETVIGRFTGVLMSISAMVCTIPGILVMMRLRSEESSGRMDILMSHKVSRFSVIGGYLAVTLIITLILQLAFSISMWIGCTIALNSPKSCGYYIATALSYIPAVWMMTSIAAALLGVCRKALAAVWGYFAYSVFVIYFGSLLKLPENCTKLTAYGNIPDVHSDNAKYGGLIAVSCIFIVLTAVGFIGYQKRDIKN